VLLGASAAEVSQVTGALLVFALLVMPAAAAQRVTARPGVSFTLTIALGIVTVWTGLGSAYVSVYPVGFFVTTVGFVFYLLAVGWSVLAGGRPRRSAAGAMAPALPR
jgi:zinc/manganese transport system permease protein